MLDSFLQPKSVAVIGASRSPGKVGYDVVKNLIEAGYKGGIFPVNPKADEILELRCYPAVDDIEDEVELAVICVPARFVLQTVEECARKGVRAVVVISSGFKESGEEGAALEKELGPHARVGYQQVRLNMRAMGGTWRDELLRSLERIIAFRERVKDLVAATSPPASQGQ